METRARNKIEELTQTIAPMLGTLALQLPVNHQCIAEVAAYKIATMNKDNSDKEALQFIQMELNKVREHIKLGGFLKTTPAEKSMINIENEIKKSNLYKSIPDNAKDQIKKLQKNDLKEKKNTKTNSQEKINLDNFLSLYENHDKWHVLEEIANEKNITENTNFYKAYIKCMTNPTKDSLLELDKNYIAEPEDAFDFNSTDTKVPVNIPGTLQKPYNEMLFKIKQNQEITPELLKPLIAIADHVADTMKSNFSTVFAEKIENKGPSNK